MASVFVPFKHSYYEGDDIFGVYSTLDLATKALATKVVQPDGSIFGDEWGVWEYEVNGSYVGRTEVYEGTLREVAESLAAPGPERSKT